MHNSRLITSGLCSVMLATLSACALPKESLISLWKEMRHKPVAPLQTGVKYEVRKALAHNVPFRPSTIKRYTFVLDDPKPPLLTSSPHNFFLLSSSHRSKFLV